jgi:hypothetical protein
METARPKGRADIRLSAGWNGPAFLTGEAASRSALASIIDARRGLALTPNRFHVVGVIANNGESFTSVPVVILIATQRQQLLHLLLAGSAIQPHALRSQLIFPAVSGTIRHPG